MRIGIMIGAALVLGAGIAFVDTRPNWDDTGITAAAVAICCGALAVVQPRRAWLHAACVAGCVFIANVIAARNFGAALVFVPAFVGAGLGSALGRLRDIAGQPQA